VTLIAETGGQNAMIVDSSALTEQVVNDVVASSFDSAGQRCSALRVLCLQDDIAARVLEMLKGAMAELALGNPAKLSVDVGPVIDAEARDNIQRHIAAMQAKGRPVFQWPAHVQQASAPGTFVPPTLIELNHIGELQREVFGPVLHVVRYKRRDLAALVQQINATGYGLTLGVHTRIDEVIAQVTTQASAGNQYVNRNMVGAVVGVQPFGGEGLSGTGPKAGGPLYLYRLLSQQPSDVAARAMRYASGAVSAADISPSPSQGNVAHHALQSWAGQNGHDKVAEACARFAHALGFPGAVTLPGPTGERNTYSLHPREAVLCLTSTGPQADSDRLVQLAAVLAVGSRAVWPADTTVLASSLPGAVREYITFVTDWTAPQAQFDAALHHGTKADSLDIAAKLANRTGAIVNLQALRSADPHVALERLLIERSLSVNTAAAGGNASLMTMAEPV
jgi:RHH-type proline utilization regulon transcriptional repressor/proline dehydrogenase/delta 1-pyrroline-5-carboxylate dehydrogenase